MRVHAARRQDGRLPLIPGGEIRVAALRTETVDVAGTPVPVTLYSVAGLSFAPYTVWLDADDQFFAAPGSWFARVRAGAEASLPRLQAIEEELQKKSVAERAQALVQAPAHDVLIHDVALFDAPSATVRPHQSVVFSGNRITQVGPADTVRAPGDAMVIEGRGLTLLPGLWDMHVHLTNFYSSILHLTSGVTTVRDMGNDVDDLMARRARIDAGDEVTKALVDTPDEVRGWIAKYHQLGYPQIKIYGSIKPDLVPLIVAEAHKYGMRVSGHIPSGMMRPTRCAPASTSFSTSTTSSSTSRRISSSPTAWCASPASPTARWTST